MSGGHHYDLHDVVQAQKYERAINDGPVNGFGGDRQILWRPFATAYPGQVGLVQLGGLEPPTSCSTDRRSNQLSYNCILRPRSWRGDRTGRKLGFTRGFGKAETVQSPLPREGI